MTRLSLILCVLRYTPDLSRLIDSLNAQECSGFEVILVDQSSDKKIEELFESKCAVSCLKYNRVGFVGLSKARNFGLQFAEGEIVAFPDDDCWYDLSTVRRVLDIFEKNADLDYLSIKTTVGPGQSESLIQSPDRKEVIEPINTRACSSTLFFRLGVVLSLNGFDERFGLGTVTPFTACEEEDLVCRAIAAGNLGFYTPTALVYHPNKGETLTLDSLRRRINYSCAKMACQIKNRRTVGLHFVLLRLCYHFVRPLIHVYAPKRCILLVAESIGTYKALLVYLKFI